MINSENWTFTQYQNENLKAFVSFGADPEMDDSIGSDEDFLYFVTLTNEEGDELYQTVHQGIDNALSTINQKYKEWNHIDLTNKSSGDGCSTCHAH